MEANRNKRSFMDKINKYKKKIENVYSKSSLLELVTIGISVITLILILIIFYYEKLSENTNKNMKIIIIISSIILLLIQGVGIFKKIRTNDKIDEVLNQDFNTDYSVQSVHRMD